MGCTAGKLGDLGDEHLIFVTPINDDFVPVHHTYPA